jgi:hypothetical protein
MHTNFLVRKFEGMRPFGRQGTEGKTTLQWVLKKGG